MPAEDGTASDLLRSETRVAILKRLRETDATRYDLREQIDCSRTTVDRNLERLEADGWITETEDGFGITTSGEIVLEGAIDFLETVEVASRLQPILQWVPREEIDLDVTEFADAELALPEEGRPMAMVDKHSQRVKGASNAKMVLPVFSPQPFDAHYNNKSLSELSIEVVATPAVADAFATEPSVSERIAEMRAAGALEIHVTDEPIPYYLGILDGTVEIGVDDDGQPRGLLEDGSEGVREWAEGRFDRFKESAVSMDEWENA